MEKTNKTTIDTRTLVFMALLVAMQIVLSKVVSIDIGFARVTISNLPIILSGLWFGPVVGGACGLVADVLGCFLKGYGVNPLITLSTMVWGIIPALMKPMMKGTKTRKIVVMCVSIFITTICGTLVLTTLGLVLMNGYNLTAILPGRLIQWAVMTPVYCVLACALHFSPLTDLVTSGTVRRAA